jgi:hypothetical protein
MTFLCLVYVEPERFASLSPSEKLSLDRNSLAYDVELQRRGHHKVSNALDAVSTARTVRVRRGKVSTTDGPFAETKEHLGGFILIDAANIDEAVDIAAGIPMAEMGSIEVRPIITISRGEP